jgi:hypothetical protein
MINFSFNLKLQGMDKTFKVYLFHLDELVPNIKNVSFTIFKRLYRQELKKRQNSN